MAWSDGDALASYTYQIEIDGVSMAQFKEVSGLSTEIQVIEHNENREKGLPVVKKLPGAVKWGDITLKRGMTDNPAFWEWINKVADEGDVDGARKNGSIVLYDYSRQGEVARFNFEYGWPSKISVGTLSAGSNEVLLEEVTITHEGLKKE